MVIARELQRFPTIFRLQRLITLSLQKVVEEIHIQLIVFGDQNSLGHTRPLWFACFLVVWILKGPP